MANWQYALLIGAVIGLLFGILVSRKSIKEKPVQGGPLAKVFHYLGASAFVSTAPTVLVGAIVYKLPFLTDLGLAFGLLATAFILLILYALFESRVAPVKVS
ncbi:MAG: hypothetical protein IT324_12225 [Anaerolineae bacterium]|nr:hypothetical protein [Anaerolineae bacterium]